MTTPKRCSFFLLIFTCLSIEKPFIYTNSNWVIFTSDRYLALPQFACYKFLLNTLASSVWCPLHIFETRNSLDTSTCLEWTSMFHVTNKLINGSFCLFVFSVDQDNSCCSTTPSSSTCSTATLLTTSCASNKRGTTSLCGMYFWLM